MKDYGIVESTVRPEAIKIDEYSVWVASDIVQVERDFEGDTVTMYQYHLVQYGKDEYITKQQQQAEQQIADTQLALCEIYEAISKEE